MEISKEHTDKSEYNMDDYSGGAAAGDGMKMPTNKTYMRPHKKSIRINYNKKQKLSRNPRTFCGLLKLFLCFSIGEFDKWITQKSPKATRKLNG